MSGRENKRDDKNKTTKTHCAHPKDKRLSHLRQNKNGTCLVLATLDINGENVYMHMRNGKERGLIYAFASTLSRSLSRPGDINLPKKKVAMTAKFHSEEEEKDDEDNDRPLTGDCCCQTNRDGECF